MFDSNYYLRKIKLKYYISTFRTGFGICRTFYKVKWGDSVYTHMHGENLRESCKPIVKCFPLPFLRLVPETHTMKMCSIHFLRQFILSLSKTSTLKWSLHASYENYQLTHFSGPATKQDGSLFSWTSWWFKEARLKLNPKWVQMFSIKEEEAFDLWEGI